MKEHKILTVSLFLYDFCGCMIVVT